MVAAKSVLSHHLLYNKPQQNKQEKVPALRKQLLGAHGFRVTDLFWAQLRSSSHFITSECRNLKAG